MAAEHGLERIGRLATGLSRDPADHACDPGPRAERASTWSARGARRRAAVLSPRPSEPRRTAASGGTSPASAAVEVAMPSTWSGCRSPRCSSTRARCCAGTFRFLGYSTWRTCGHLLHLPAMVPRGAGQAQQPARLVSHADCLVDTGERVAPRSPAHHVAVTHGSVDVGSRRGGMSAARVAAPPTASRHPPRTCADGGAIAATDASGRPQARGGATAPSARCSRSCPQQPVSGRLPASARRSPAS